MNSEYPVITVKPRLYRLGYISSFRCIRNVSQTRSIHERLTLTITRVNDGQELRLFRSGINSQVTTHQYAESYRNLIQCRKKEIPNKRSTVHPYWIGSRQFNQLSFFSNQNWNLNGPFRPVYLV